ncbi:MAG: hypothetical protein JTJ20_12885, partial [Blautia sp.]|nr:hypothetical protein [Blautia sp.]
GVGFMESVFTPLNIDVGLFGKRWKICCRKSNLPFSLQNWMFSRAFQKHPVFGFRLREFL